MEYYNITFTNMTQMLLDANTMTNDFAIPMLFVLVPAIIIALYLKQKTGELYNAILVGGLYSIFSLSVLIIMGLVAQEYFAICIIIIALIGLFKFIGGSQ